MDSSCCPDTATTVAISGQSPAWLDMDQPYDSESVMQVTAHESNETTVAQLKRSSGCMPFTPVTSNNVLKDLHQHQSAPLTGPLISAPTVPLPAANQSPASLSAQSSSRSVEGLLSAMEGKKWAQFIAQDRCLPAPVPLSSAKSSDCENMKLKKEDISIFGLCPARDQFFATSCDLCGQVVKFQALAHHMETRHSHPAPGLAIGIETPPSSTRSESSSGGSTSSLSNNLINCDQDQQSSSAFNVLDQEYGAATQISRLTPSPGTESPIADTQATDASSTRQPQCIAIATRTGVCIKISSIPPSSSPLPSSRGLTSHDDADHCLTSSVAGSGVTVSPLPADLPASVTGSSGMSLLKPTSVSVKLKGNSQSGDSTPTTKKSKKNASSSLSSSQTPGKEKLLPCKDRQYDPNKHCGVRTESVDKACTRSLTCKTHSLTLRRQVEGRSKSFDDLLEEHRQAKEEALRLAGKEVKLTKKQMKQREQEAKKAFAAQQKTDPKNTALVSVLSPASSSRPSPACSPSVVPSNRSSGQVQNLPAPISSPVSVKQSLQNNLNAKIKRKAKEETEQQKSSQITHSAELRTSEINSNGCDFEPQVQSSMRTSANQPLVLRQPEKNSRFEGPDGIEYLKHPPRPLAVNTYNARVRKLGSSRSLLEPFSISSRSYSRGSDYAYAVMGKMLQMTSQENKVTTSITVGANSVTHGVKNKKKKLSSSSSSGNFSSNSNGPTLKLPAVDVTLCGTPSPALSVSETDSNIGSSDKECNVNGTSVRKKAVSRAGVSAPYLTALLESRVGSSSPLPFSLDLNGSTASASATSVQRNNTSTNNNGLASPMKLI